MHRIVLLSSLPILSLALLLPSLGSAQDKKADSKSMEKIKPDWSAEFVGKLTELNDSEDRLLFTVQINYKYPELNQDAQRQIAQHQQTMVQQQLQLLKAKSIQERQNALNQMANTQQQIDQSTAQLYKIKEMNIDVRCRAAENFRVRKYEAMQVMDPDTGEFIKMTKELMAEAKGKEGFPGYKADSKILRTGQYVGVYVWKDTKTPANFLDKNKQSQLKPEELRAELKNFRYDVIMLYVAADVPPKN